MWKGAVTLLRDFITNVLIVIDYVHHEIHKGSHFVISGCDVLGVSDVLEFTITTPNTIKWSHLLFYISTYGNATLEIFENTTNIVAGSTIIPINSNRNNTDSSVNSIKKDPTSVTAGDLLFTFLSGSNKNVGLFSRENELILKQNTSYLFRITSNASTNLTCYNGEWYEHTNKN